MISIIIPPSPILKDYLKEIRLRHFLCNEPEKMSFKPYPPRPEQCISFYPRGKEFYKQTNSDEKNFISQAVITAQFTESINRFISKEFLMITVVLKPGILYRLTGIPQNELYNKHINLEDVFPKETRNVCTQLKSTDSYNEMIYCIDMFFISIIKKIKIFEQPQDQIFEVMVDKPNNYSLDWLAKQAHLSPRQLERKFNQYIGICPKFFARIIRFEQSYNLRLQNLNKDWLSIAILSGYYDYQHLVKDYKEFVNASPNQFFTEEEKAPGRMLGLTKPGIFNWLRKES